MHGSRIQATGWTVCAVWNNPWSTRTPPWIQRTPKPFYSPEHNSFNISNKLFVTLDVLLAMQFHVQLGEPVHNCCQSVLQSSMLHQRPGGLITHQEERYLEGKLYDGYFAFEALTCRQGMGWSYLWNMWCCTHLWEWWWQLQKLYTSQERAGIIIIAVVIDSLHVYMRIYNMYIYNYLKSHCLHAHALMVQFLWPDDEGEVQSTEVNIDEWWSTIDMKMVEAAAFSSARQESIPVDQIAPWIAPACRGSTVVNSEVLKGERQL